MFVEFVFTTGFDDWIRRIKRFSAMYIRRRKIPVGQLVLPPPCAWNWFKKKIESCFAIPLLALLAMRTKHACPLLAYSSSNSEQLFMELMVAMASNIPAGMQVTGNV